MEKQYQIIKPKHGYYKGECLDAKIAPTIDTGVGCWHILIGESYGTENQMRSDRLTQRGGYERMHDIARRVYGTDGLAPTMHTCGGGNLEPKILEPLALDEQNGYIRQDGIVGTLTTDGSSPKHNNRIIEPICLNSKVDGKQPSLTDRVYDTDGVSVCATTSPFFMGNIAEPRIAAMRGRNPENPSDRTAGSPTEQRLEIGSDETSNTLTTVQKDNLVVEPTNYRFFEQAFETLCENDCEAGDTIDAFNKRVNKDGVSPTITTRPDGFKTAILPITQDYRIRKLTEKECGRLMGVKNEDCEKIAKNQSTSSQYHLYGDSIAVPCLMAIFGELFSVDYNDKINSLTKELRK